MITDQIDKELLALAKQSDIELDPVYRRIDAVCMNNSDRILSAFIVNNVSYTDFADINGYGNYDAGRDKLERIFADVLGSEDALVRPQIMSGTNALYIAFSGLLKHGDTMISLTGTPYDSLQEMIGRKESYDKILGNHGNYEYPMELLENVLESCDLILTHKDAHLAVHMFGEDLYSAHAIKEDGMRVDGKPGNVLYADDKVC